MIDLEKIKLRILEGEPIEKILSGFEWAGFEEAVAEIFVANGFCVKRNFRFKTKGRHEIDIIAYKVGHKMVYKMERDCVEIVCVDCKGWRGGRSKKSGVLKAAEKQKERTAQFEKFVSTDPTVRRMLDITAASAHAEHIAMVVTLLEEDVKDDDGIPEHAGVLIVPVWKLNSLLGSF